MDKLPQHGFYNQSIQSFPKKVIEQALSFFEGRAPVERDKITNNASSLNRT